MAPVAAPPKNPVTAPAVVLTPTGPSDILGRVLHRDRGTPLAGALVILKCDGTARNVELWTDDMGTFRFVAVPAVSCLLQVLLGTGNETVPLGVSAADRREIKVLLDPARKFEIEMFPRSEDADYVKVPLHRE